MRVFGCNDMQGNFISTGNAKSASNYHGTISTQGKLLLINQGSTKVINFNTPVCLKASQGCDFYDAKVNGDWWSGCPGKECTSMIHNGLRAAVDAYSGSEIKFRSQTVLSNATEYLDACKMARNSNTGTNYTEAECDQDITPQKLNAIARSGIAQYMGHTVLRFNNSENHTHPGFTDYPSEELDGTFAFLVVGTASKMAYGNYQSGLKFNNNLPPTTSNSSVLLYFENFNNSWLGGTQGNEAWLAVYNGGTGNYFIVANGVVNSIGVISDNKNNTINGGVWFGDVKSGTNAWIGGMGHQTLWDPGSRRGTIKYDPEVIGAFDNLGISFSGVLTEGQIATCLEEPNEVVVLGDQLILKKLGSYLSVTPVAVGIPDIVISGGKPRLQVTPQVYTVQGDQCKSATSFKAIDASYISKSISGNTDGCGSITYSALTTGSKIKSILGSTPIEHQGTYPYQYNVTCTNGSDQAYMNLVIDCDASAPPEIIDSIGKPIIPVVDSASLPPTFYHGLLKGVYEFKHANSKKCMDVSSGSEVDGANIQIWFCNNTHAQRYRLKKLGNGVWEIQNFKSKKVLDVANGGSGTNVQQWGGSAWGSSQRWKIIPGSREGLWTIKSQYNLGRCIQPSSYGDGSNAYMERCNGSTFQEWELIDASTRDQVKTGTYYISNNHNQKCLDVAGAASWSGANIQIYACNYSEAQIWNVKRLWDGVFEIKNRGSGKVLSIQNGGYGSNIEQYGTSASINSQRWRVEYKENGAFYMRSVYDNNQCAIADGKSANWNLHSNWNVIKQTCAGAGNGAFGDAYPGELKWQFVAFEVEVKGYNIYQDEVTLRQDVRRHGGTLINWWDCVSSTATGEFQGGRSLKTKCKSMGGVAVHYPRKTDISHLRNPRLKFWIRSTSNKLRLKLEWGAFDGEEKHKYDEKDLKDYGLNKKNKWQYITVPLSDFSKINTKKMTVPFNIYSAAGVATFYVDNVVIKYD
ncbi:MAG: RICIN domain-containing protein, partial [Fibrobacterales bacterium]